VVARFANRILTKTSHHRPGDKLILVAEDNTDDYTRLETAYVRTGLPNPFRRAMNGLEVIAWLQRLGPYGDRRLFPPPDLLLLDLEMPGMGGFQVLEWIHRSAWWSKLPVVVLSGSSLATDREKARALGARAFYTKTHGMKQIEDMLVNICHDWLGYLQAA
jgi:CheY-like chemotaxis protein